IFLAEISTSSFVLGGRNMICGIVRDVTKRVRVEEALRDSEEKYRLLVENANDAIFIIQDGIVKFPNFKTEEMTGYSVKELYEIPFVNIIHPDDREMVLERRRKRLLGEKPPSTYSFRMINKSGDELLVQINTVLITWEGNPATINFIRDITEQKRLEAQLHQAQKMESVGLLAGGVAHDLNNVLSGIVSYPELLLLDLPEDSKLREPIKTMKESGFRASAIVQDLLTVARGVAATKEPLNLNDLVKDYINSPEFKRLKEFHPVVTIKLNLYSNLLNITGSHVHIRKVIMNLVSNASEAIDGSGNVIISTMNRYIDRPLKGYDDVTIGEYAVLTVSDDGSGISSGDLERIFDPFYTKKVLGRSGTGLGLAVVWNVVQDHEGYIDVKSDEYGTMFELYFSITRDEISDKVSIPIKDYKGSGETILVVDDVESQRKISCKMLETLGYKTKAVSSGEEAVEYLKENAVDLILLDMIMEPGINGRETYERIIKIHPNQKAIITSGFAETDDVKKAQQLGAGQYIKKPLTLKKIGIAVRDELKM
ncbi:MAG: PAS domain S-box protein, partial [Desulfobacterales bacterium]